MTLEKIEELNEKLKTCNNTNMDKDSAKQITQNIIKKYEKRN